MARSGRPAGRLALVGRSVMRKYIMHSHLDVIHTDYHCMAQDDKGAFAALVD